MTPEQISRTAVIISLGYLVIASLFDIRKKAIPLLLPMVLIAAAAVWDIHLYMAYGRDVMTYERILALMPGVLFLALSLVAGHKIGAGDGLSLLGLGQFMGALAVFLTMCAGLFLSALFSCILILAGKAGKVGKTATIPFLPFLGAGFLLVMGILH